MAGQTFLIMTVYTCDRDWSAMIAEVLTQAARRRDELSRSAARAIAKAPASA